MLQTPGMSPPASRAPRHPTVEVLSYPPVRYFYAAQLCSTLGFSLLNATIAWHIWKATGSYALLGTLGLVEFLPVIPLSLLGGAIADSADRRLIVVCSWRFGGAGGDPLVVGA